MTCRWPWVAWITAALLLLPASASAQSINVNLGAAGPTATGQIVRLVLLITVLSLAPSSWS